MTVSQCLFTSVIFGFRVYLFSRGEFGFNYNMAGHEFGGSVANPLANQASFMSVVPGCFYECIMNMCAVGCLY